MTVQHAGDESWDIIGQQLAMHNSFWGWTDGERSACRVVGYIGKYQFDSGAESKHTFVIRCEGNYYPARHNAVADAIADPAVRRRIRKAAPPRLVRRTGQPRA